MKKLAISKLDAAKRQLETVIRLYFCNGDPVSIHTLTAAAYNVIRDLNIKRGGEVMVKELLVRCAKEGHEKEVRQKQNEAENFFKHADRDYDGTVHFNPDHSELLICEACEVYHELSGEFPPLFKIYSWWFRANHPDLFRFSEEEISVLSMMSQEIVDLGREAHFRRFLPIAFRVS